MEALVVIGVLIVLIAVGGGYLVWRDRRRGMSAGDPAGTRLPAADAERHGLPGHHFQQGHGDGGV